NAKYAIIGLLLLLTAGIAIFLGRGRGGGGGPDQTPTNPTTNTPTPGPDASVSPIGPPVGATIDFNLDAPDAGPAASAPVVGPRPPNRQTVVRPHYSCPGEVDSPRVTAVVQANYGALRECYNRQLRSNPTLQGSVTAEWIINTNGSTGQISTSGLVS